LNLSSIFRDFLGFGFSSLNLIRFGVVLKYIDLGIGLELALWAITQNWKSHNFDKYITI